jgi:16S rRNA (adenine1518-N6/adenine1519-N6)-dimethyltransferase
VYGVPKIITKVGREYFSPKPDVDSAVIHIANISKNFFQGFSEKEFFVVVKEAFQFKRKNIVNNLKNKFPDIENTLSKLDISSKVRSEDLSLDDFAQITKILYSIS